MTEISQPNSLILINKESNFSLVKSSKGTDNFSTQTEFIKNESIKKLLKTKERMNTFFFSLNSHLSNINKELTGLSEKKN